MRIIKKLQKRKRKKKGFRNALPFSENTHSPKPQILCIYEQTRSLQGPDSIKTAIIKKKTLQLVTSRFVICPLRICIFLFFFPLQKPHILLRVCHLLIFLSTLFLFLNKIIESSDTDWHGSNFDVCICILLLSSNSLYLNRSILEKNNNGSCIFYETYSLI